jgi:hypothetical protein
MTTAERGAQQIYIRKQDKIRIEREARRARRKTVDQITVILDEWSATRSRSEQVGPLTAGQHREAESH